jgi:voltage-dependent calcium channel
VIVGIFATTLPIVVGTGNTAIKDAQKFFLTAICFKLVQKVDSLNQLFKVAAASLPAILSLFALWVVLFIVWSIMMLEVFGLTRWGPNETYAKNFSTFWRSFVFLSMMSTGEGWNSYMHDYTLQPPLCIPNSNYLFSDCGSPGWAYFLFISWNIVSMYVFVNSE